MPLWLNYYGLESEKRPNRPSEGKTRNRGGLDTLPTCKKSNCLADLDLGNNYLNNCVQKGKQIESEGWLHWTVVSDKGCRLTIAQPLLFANIDSLVMAISRMFPKRLLGYSNNCLVFPSIGRKTVKEYLVKYDTSSTTRLSIITEITKLFVGFSQMVSEVKIKNFPKPKSSHFIIVGKDCRIIAPTPDLLITICLAIISREQVLPTILPSSEPTWFSLGFAEVATELLSKSIRSQPIESSFARVGKTAFRKLREVISDSKKGIISIDQVCKRVFFFFFFLVNFRYKKTNNKQQQAASMCISIRNRHTRKLDNLKVFDMKDKSESRFFLVTPPPEKSLETCALTAAGMENFFSEGAYTVVCG